MSRCCGLVVLYNILYKVLYNKFVTNRSNGVCALLINCSEQQPEHQTEASPTAQPDLVYADIARNHEPDLGNHNVYSAAPTAPPMNISVLYSELQSNNNDNNNHLYAQVQRR